MKFDDKFMKFMIIKRIYPREVNWLEMFRGINNASFRNSDLKINININ